MNKKSIWILVGIVVIIVIAGSVYAANHKSTSTATTSTNTASPNQSPSTSPSASPNASASPTSSSGSTIIVTKTASNIGPYLAEANGMALYTYGADTAGKSNCTGSCLTNWPIYAATNAPSTLPAHITVITRTDGHKQYAYKTMPLYTFTGDTAGSVSGDNISNFHVATP